MYHPEPRYYEIFKVNIGENMWNSWEELGWNINAWGDEALVKNSKPSVLRLKLCYCKKTPFELWEIFIDLQQGQTLGNCMATVRVIRFRY